MPEFLADHAAEIRARMDAIKAEEERARRACPACGYDVTTLSICYRKPNEPACGFPAVPASDGYGGAAA